MPVNPAPVENVKETETVVCTMDAMMCPDGTYVGRTGLKCEFVCPEIATSTTVIKTTIGLDTAFEFNSIPMRVWAVTEDSRCPSDVTCIQAGRVKIALNVGSSSAEMESGQTIKVEGLSITLDEVSPYPVSTRKTQDGEYKFAFTIKPQ